MVMHIVSVILSSFFIFGFTISEPIERKNTKDQDSNSASQETDTAKQEKPEKTKKQLEEMQGELDMLNNETWDDRYYKN